MNIRNLLMCCVLALLLSSCHVGRFFTLNMPDMQDQQRFPKLDVANSDTVWPLTYAQTPSFNFDQTVNIPRGEVVLSKLLKRTGTSAFIVIKNDSVIVEEYYNGFDDGASLPSFSVSKSL